MTDEKPKVLMFSEEIEGHNMRGGLAGAVSGLARRLRSDERIDARIVIPHRERYRGSLPSADGWGRLGDSSVFRNTIEDVPVYAHNSGIFPTLTAGSPAQNAHIPLTYPPTYMSGNISPEVCKNLYSYAKDFLKQVPSALEEHEGFAPDILHIHDWPGAFIPFLIKMGRANERAMWEMKTLFTNHNAAYDGRIGLTLDTIRTLRNILTIGGLALGEIPVSAVQRDFMFNGFISMQKIGAETADLSTTVSKDYAGFLNDGSLGERLRVDWGVSSGLDGTVMDAFDLRLGDPPNFSEEELLKLDGRKRAEKALLLQYYGVQMGNENKPLISMVARLDDIKGVERLLDTLQYYDGAYVLIGGPVRDPNIKHRLDQAKAQYKGKHVIITEFIKPDDVNSIMKASDYFVAPSWTVPEPDGRTVKEALLYVTVPIVPETSGSGYRSLEQKVREKAGDSPFINFYINEETRFLTSKYNSALSVAMTTAINENKERLMERRALIVKAVNNGALSWEPAVAKYAEAYQKLAR